MVRIGDYEMPDDLYYHKKHMWVKIEDGKARIGIDDFTQKMAGDIVYVDVPPKGDTLTQGVDFGTIESGKWVGKIIAPISGEVVEENEAVIDDPTLVNKDPYGDGWIAIVIPSKLDEELKSLIHGNAVADWIKIEEAEALKV
ncbi:MAG: glycine cleavage system protein GcvH, partial [Candidatus Bathyarchaeia archaeon]